MGIGDHPKTFLVRALFCQSTPSWLKDMGGNVQAAMWWWPVRLYCQLLGLGVPIPIPIPSPSPSRLTIVYNLIEYAPVPSVQRIHATLTS